jgi:hypothetical protein
MRVYIFAKDSTFVEDESWATLLKQPRLINATTFCHLRNTMSLVQLVADIA